MPKYLTTRQAAERLQVNIDSIRRYIGEGYLKAYKLGGNHNSKRHWRIKEEDLDAFVSGKCAVPAGKNRGVQNKDKLALAVAPAQRHSTEEARQ